MKIAEKCKVVVAGAIVASLMAGTALPALAARPAGDVPFAVLAQQNGVSADKVQAIKDTLANIDVSYEDGVWLFESAYENYEIDNNKSYVMPYVYSNGETVRFGMSFTSQDTEGYFYWNDVDVLIGEYNNYTSQTNYKFKKVSREYYPDDQIFYENVSFGGNDEDMDCLSRILSAGTAYLRFNGVKVNGTQRTQTTIIDNESRQGMTDIINLYNLLQSATAEERVAAAKAVMSENAPAENDFLDAQNDAVTPEQVEAMILQIAPVTLESETAINNAQAAFDSMPTKWQSMVSNYDKLKLYQEELEDLQVDALAEKLNNTVYREHDDVENVDFFFWKDAPLTNQAIFALPYFCVVDNNVQPLRMMYSQFRTSWIFWNTIVYSIDGEVYKKTIDSSKIERRTVTQVLSGNVNTWELADDVADPVEIEMLRKAVTAKNAVVRFKGDSMQSDWKLSSFSNRDIKNISGTLQAYDAMLNASPSVRAKALEKVEAHKQGSKFLNLSY
ncbi:MAG: hypothetical protein UDS56_00615 [Faecalibacterium prausnitzii]|jgi:hypothetical protein|nr:hypothetical protein [Faecalibacterium prausnitzii]